MELGSQPGQWFAWKLRTLQFISSSFMSSLKYRLTLHNKVFVARPGYVVRVVSAFNGETSTALDLLEDDLVQASGLDGNF